MSDSNDKLNRDLITGAPGSHPVGTGVGAAGGAVTGAAAGSLAGPLGAIAGAVVGAVVGGLAGKSAAEVINPTDEEAYWHAVYEQEPYFVAGHTFAHYGPAYRAGWEARVAGTDWDTTRAEWARKWDREHAQGGLKWEKAQPAVKAAWDRANRRYVQETGY